MVIEYPTKCKVGDPFASYVDKVFCDEADITKRCFEFDVVAGLAGCYVVDEAGNFVIEGESSRQTILAGKIEVTWKPLPNATALAATPVQTQ